MTPPTPSVPGADPTRSTPVFARVVAFDVECPVCSAVDCVRQGRSRVKRKARFDPFRSRWQCPSCRRVFAIGLVIWPVRRAGNRPRGGGAPVDTIPTMEQIKAIRELHGLTFWATRGWHDPVNLVCSCGDEAHPQPECPLHGTNYVADAP